MKLIKNEWEIQKIGKLEADAFVEEWHYAHKAGFLAHRCYGLFYKGDPSTLHGVAIWNTPALGAAKYISDNHQSVLGLSRFCLRNDRPENAGSYLISNSIKMLNTKRWKTLLTYADTAQNHNGGLYRASNWDYNGVTKKNPYYVNDKGEMVSRKSGAKTYSKQEMLDKGYIFKGNFSKHMFIYPTSRKNRRSLAQQIELKFTEDGKIKV